MFIPEVRQGSAEDVVNLKQCYFRFFNQGSAIYEGQVTDHGFDLLSKSRLHQATIPVSHTGILNDPSINV